MRVEITGRHLSVTDGIRAMVEAKLARLERLMNDSAVSAQLVFAREKTMHRVDITLHARGEKFLHGAGRGVNWPAAVRQAVDKIAQQAKTVKGKYEERRRRGPRETAAVVQPAAPAQRKVRATAARMPPILRQATQIIQTMTVAAATRQLRAADGVVVFRDSETASITVLCRNTSGELLLVETDA